MAVLDVCVREAPEDMRASRCAPEDTTASRCAPKSAQPAGCVGYFVCIAHTISHGGVD
jgi:hypothetical protein